MDREGNDMWAMRGEGREMHDSLGRRSEGRGDRVEERTRETEGESYRVRVRGMKEYNSKPRDRSEGSQRSMSTTFKEESPLNL